MRRRIAENMAASKRAIPHFTYVEEIDVTALEAMRGDLNAHRGERPKLTMLPFMIVAIRSEEHTSELQSLMRISYAVFCLKKKNTRKRNRLKYIHQSDKRLTYSSK